jgi:NADH-quinone oxidoreductase subunit E
VNEFYNRHKEEIDQIIAKYPTASPEIKGGPNYRRSAVMPLLYIAQREHGYVSHADMAAIGELLGVSTTEVGGIAGFYSLYYESADEASADGTPTGRYRIQVCNDLPCALRGADEFLKQVCEYLGIGIGETTPDGLFTVEAVKCLAACHRAPMFQVQGDGDIAYHEHQTIETAKAWIEEARQKVMREKEGE